MLTLIHLVLFGFLRAIVIFSVSFEKLICRRTFFQLIICILSELKEANILAYNWHNHSILAHVAGLDIERYAVIQFPRNLRCKLCHNSNNDCASTSFLRVLSPNYFDDSGWILVL
jgi:hypothetical protein